MVSKATIERYKTLQNKQYTPIFYKIEFMFFYTAYNPSVNQWYFAKCTLIKKITNDWNIFSLELIITMIINELYK